MKASRLIRIFSSLSVGIVLISALSWLALAQVSGSINRIDVFSGLKLRPEKASSALNYLLVGSDTREGLTKAEQRLLKVGSTKTAAGARSDTILLVHISKARDKVVMISIPRDSLAVVPAHIGLDGKSQIPEVQAKINAAFAWGGAPLLIQTLEAKTNLHIDHYIEIGFAGFAAMVDAIGGIEVCTKRDINDPKSHLILPAGVHTLNGIESLKYVRTRDFDGMGDLGRMQRQQQFMSAVLKKVTSSGTLLNPIKLTNFFNAAMSTIKTDSELNKNDLITLAKQLRNLSASKVRTLTIPLENTNANIAGIGSVVVWDSILAPELFQRLRDDQAIIDDLTPSPSASSSTKPETKLIDKFKTRSADENPCGALK